MFFRMNRAFAFALALLAGGLLSGCQPAALDDLMQGRKIEYKTDENQQNRRLEHPPDIISDALTSDADAAAEDDGVSLSEYRIDAVPEAAEAGSVAPDARSAAVSLAGAGNLLWLEVELPPEKAWETAREFWLARMGFPLERDEPRLGFMETEWLELRALRGFGLAGVLDNLLGRLRDSGERDKFRTRVDPADNRQRSRIYIAHRHVAEIYDLRRDGVRAGLQPMPADPHLEAEMLRRMMLYIAGEDLQTEAEAEATDEVAAADGVESTVSATVASTVAADAEGGDDEAESDEDAPVALGEDYELRGDSLLIKKPLREAFLLVRIGLDRGGFTLEDRDVSEASFYIRHSGGPESDRIFGASEQGFFNRLFVRADPVVREIKIQLTAEGEHSAARAAAADDEGELTAAQSEALLRLLAENLP